MSKMIIATNARRKTAIRAVIRDLFADYGHVNVDNGDGPVQYSSAMLKDATDEAVACDEVTLSATCEGAQPVWIYCVFDYEQPLCEVVNDHYDNETTSALVEKHFPTYYASSK